MLRPDGSDVRVLKSFNGVSRTKQSFKDECDINAIVRRFVKTGDVSVLQVRARGAMYSDVSDVGDLQRAYSVVDAAREGFQALPAKVRERFDNSPVRLLEFLSRWENLQEAVDLGLVRGKAPVIPVSPGPASVSSPAPAAPAAGGVSGTSEK